MEIIHNTEFSISILQADIGVYSLDCIKLTLGNIGVQCVFRQKTFHKSISRGLLFDLNESSKFFYVLMNSL